MNKQAIIFWIEEISKRMLINNPFAIKARDGLLNEDHLRVYLNSMMYNIQHTPIFLKAAIQSSRDYGLHELAKFLEEKLQDEAGHDDWVKSDLDHFKPESLTNLEFRPTQAITKMVDYLRHRVKKTPIGFLGYVAFLEYFTVLTAPKFLQDLENHCGIPKKKLMALVKHGELDKIHAQDNFAILDQILNSEEKWRDFIDTIKVCSEYLDEHFIECAAAV